MSLNIITIGSAFYGNMEDKNLYQCSIDSKLKTILIILNVFILMKSLNLKVFLNLK